MTRCDSCDIDTGPDPVVVGGRAFCCRGCAEGGPCVCAYVLPEARHPRNGHADKVVQELLLGGPGPGPTDSSGLPGPGGRDPAGPGL